MKMHLNWKGEGFHLRPSGVQETKTTCRERAERITVITSLSREWKLVHSASVWSTFYSSRWKQLLFVRATAFSPLRECRVSCQKSKYKIIRVCEYHVQSRCCIIKRTKQKTITLGMLNVFWLVWMHYDSERWQWMIFFLLCPAFIRHIWQLIDSLRLGRLWCHKRPYLPNLCTTVFFPPVGCSVRRIRPVSTIPVQSSATRVRKGLTRKVENQKKPENWIKLLQQLNLQASEPVRLRHWRALNHICVWSQHVGKLCGYWWLEELYSVAWR